MKTTHHSIPKDFDVQTSEKDLNHWHQCWLVSSLWPHWPSFTVISLASPSFPSGGVLPLSYFLLKPWSWLIKMKKLFFFSFPHETACSRVTQKSMWKIDHICHSCRRFSNLYRRCSYCSQMSSPRMLMRSLLECSCFVGVKFRDV